MKRFGALCAVCAMWATAASAVDVRAAVLRIDYTQMAPTSRFDEQPDDLGFAGARLATEDNATTGGFLGHTYRVEEIATAPEGAAAALDQLLEEGIDVVAIMGSDDDLVTLADQAGDRALIFNVAARGTRLRSQDCRANLLHITPSTAMLADAAVQFIAWKKWDRAYMIRGSHDVDKELADAYRRSAARFGVRIVEEREFEDTGGARRTDTGHVLVQRQLPVFTEGASRHDVVIAADASDVFATYLPYHQWDPRPVIGAAGLRPVTFHGAHEAWGATQFQRRFEALAGRYIREQDYDAWLALRVVGEAVTRTGSSDVSVLRDYILSDQFELAAFKGQKVTFRSWNGQLRQPILLFDGRITASVSPQEGFLHQTSPLDTLGLDAPESQCGAF